MGNSATAAAIPAPPPPTQCGSGSGARAAVPIGIWHPRTAVDGRIANNNTITMASRPYFPPPSPPTVRTIPVHQCIISLVLSSAGDPVERGGGGRTRHDGRVFEICSVVGGLTRLLTHETYFAILTTRKRNGDRVGTNAIIARRI